MAVREDLESAGRHLAGHIDWRAFHLGGPGSGPHGHAQHSEDEANHAYEQGGRQAAATLGHGHPAHEVHPDAELAGHAAAGAEEHLTRQGYDHVETKTTANGHVHIFEHPETRQSAIVQVHHDSAGHHVTVHAEKQQRSVGPPFDTLEEKRGLR
jgi:hypothetical protein